MGPMYWMPQSPTKLLKCSERKSNSCDLTETDGCCAIIPCTLCLEFFVAPGTYSYGEAPFAGSSWSGSVAGAAFVAYWEQDYQSGECEFIVAVDGIIVYRKSCYEGADCRDPSGSTTVTIGSDSGTLSWSVYESRPLEYIQDPDTNCRTYFCDDCDCSCECLCVTVTDLAETETKGEICDTAYDCDAPLWEGEVGGIALSVALDRDQYGQCVIVVTADGEEQPPVLFPGCSDALATVTLGDGTTIAFSCKRCSCEQTEGCPCCPGWPLERSADIYFASIEATVNDCVPIIALQEYSDTFGCTGTTPYPIFQNVGNLLYVRVVCDPDTLAWVVEYKSLATGMVANDVNTGTWVAVVYDFICPDCADAIDGVAYGSFDFVAVHACETSGGLVTFDVLVHADVEVQCV